MQFINVGNIERGLSSFIFLLSANDIRHLLNYLYQSLKYCKFKSLTMNDIGIFIYNPPDSLRYSGYLTLVVRRWSPTCGYLYVLQEHYIRKTTEMIFGNNF